MTDEHKTPEAGPSVEQPVGRPDPERACDQGCTDFDGPRCDKCGAPITTGAMAMLCPYGRQCALVENDEHWQTVEEMRVDFGIERVKLPNTKLKDGHE